MSVDPLDGISRFTRYNRNLGQLGLAVMDAMERGRGPKGPGSTPVTSWAPSPRPGPAAAAAAVFMAARAQGDLPTCRFVSRARTEVLHRRVPLRDDVASTLVMSAVAFGVWMLGVWMGDLHTPFKVVHGLGALLAIVGAIMTFFCGWLAYRAFVVQHRR